jgi:hypothetical protein
MAKARGRPRKASIVFVLDNSVAMAWTFEDEVDEYSDAVLDCFAEVRAIVHKLWPLEVAIYFAQTP